MRLNALAEYLLAYRRPKSPGALVRIGVIVLLVPVFPAGETLTFSAYPGKGSYKTIGWGWELSPAMVPGAFLFTTMHSGIELQTGPAGALTLSDSYNVWLEITQNDPMTTTVTNISGMNQFAESIVCYLNIASQEDYEEIMELVRQWGGRK